MIKDLCILDRISTPVFNLCQVDPDLKQYLSYNPRHNMVTNIEQELGFSEEYIKNPNRDIITTDRSGWRGYDLVYSNYISILKFHNLKLLEIGIESGYGLLAWSRYFNNATIYGMEIQTKFENYYDDIRKYFPEESKRINFYYPVDSRNPKDWEKLFEISSLDIIIDDGSHSTSSQLRTLIIGLKFVKSKGFYFIEDIKYHKISQNRIFAFLIRTLEYLVYTNSILYYKIYSHENIYRKKFILNNQLSSDTPYNYNNYMIVIQKA